MGDVRDRDALGAVVLADPVGIRKVDADGRGRITVSGEAHGVDDLRGNALDGSLPEARVHGGVVLEPLGVRTQGLGAARGLEVLDIDIALPGALASQRVVVVLDESVDEVHGAEGVLHPFDVELVPLAEVAGAVVFHEEAQGADLDVVLGHFAGLQEFVADLLERGGIDAADLPGKFADDPVLTLDDLGVEAVGDGTGILRVHDAGVVFLHLVTGDAVIEVHGRQGDDVAGRFRGAALGISSGVVDDVHQVRIVDADRLQQLREIGSGAGREDLVLGVVVVHAVGEEDTFGVNRKGFKVSALAVALIVFQDILHGVAHAEVVLAVLVPEDIPAILGGFRKVVGIFLLFQGQAVPSGYLVTHDLEVGEGVHGIAERLFRLLFRAGAHEGGGSQCHHHLADRVHRFQFGTKL